MNPEHEKLLDSLEKLKVYCSQFVEPLKIQLDVVSKCFKSKMTTLSRYFGLNLEFEIRELEKTILMRFHAFLPIPRETNATYRLKAAQIFVRHYKDPANKKRTVLSKTTKELLEKLYVEGIYPNKSERDRIALKCNLTPQQVRVWFGNRRYRDKSRKEGFKFVHNCHEV